MISAAVKFKNYTKFDLLSYFNQVEEFFKTGYVQMSDYYNGVINKVDTVHQKNLEDLIKKSEKVSEQFKNNREKFQTVDFWELLDFCEDIKLKLQTTTNLAKFLRSSRTDFGFASGFAYDYTVGNQQTLEGISSKILDDEDPENDWVSIAKSNDLMEVDYDIDGGNELKLYRERFLGGFVTGIIDTINGESIYGKDIYKKITFEDNDLLVLNYKDTVFQAVEILSGLKQGDIPEFPHLGVNEGMYVGSNLAGMAYSTIVREMKKVFASDDLFVNFKINNISQKEDYLEISFQVETKYGLLVEKTRLI